MPASIGVASFVFGVVFVLAALIGKELKIAAVEVPALEPRGRILVGMVGLALVGFGIIQANAGTLTEGDDGAPAGITTAGITTAGITTATIGPGPTATAPAIDAECPLPRDHLDHVEVGVAISPRSDGALGEGQPRHDELSIQFRTGGEVLGTVVFATRAEGMGFDILRVVDAECRPVTGYRNVSDPKAHRDMPGNYQNMNYTFGEHTVTIDMSYAEGGDRINYRASLVP